MATVVLHPNTQTIPIGTTVKVFPRGNPPRQPSVSGTPLGTEATSAAVVADGSLTFTGLSENEPYVGYVATPDRYLYFLIPSATGGGGSGLSQAEIETLNAAGTLTELFLKGSASNALLRVTSTSTSNHAAVINNQGTSGEVSALRVQSSNKIYSAMELSGKEFDHGTFKIAHENPEAGATFDQNAAAISIDLQGQGGVVGKPTAGQGIFMTSTTGANTGPWVNIRNTAKALLYRIMAGGTAAWGKSTLETPEPGTIGIGADASPFLFSVDAAGNKWRISHTIGAYVATTLNAPKIEAAGGSFYSPAVRYEGTTPGATTGAIARLKGVIKVAAANTLAAGELVLTIPAGERPAATVVLRGLLLNEGGETAGEGVFNLNTAGELKLVAGAASILEKKLIVLDSMTWSIT